MAMSPSTTWDFEDETADDADVAAGTPGIEAFIGVHLRHLRLKKKAFP
jgi:hypothetical protein